MKKKKTEEDKSFDDIIKNRKSKLYITKEYFSLLVRFLLLISIISILFLKIFCVKIVRGNNMYPFINDGDVVIIYRLQNYIAKSDVVLYRFQDKEYLGRIIAQSKDRIDIKDNGTYFINNGLQTDVLQIPTYPKGLITYPVKVPDNSYFVLGDNRITAEDSREFNVIYRNWIIGKVITVIKRRGI